MVMPSDDAQLSFETGAAAELNKRNLDDPATASTKTKHNSAVRFATDVFRHIHSADTKQAPGALRAAICRPELKAHHKDRRWRTAEHHKLVFLIGRIDILIGNFKTESA